jgi:hypothetical protein
MNPDKKAISDRLINETGSWRSIELRYHEDYTCDGKMDAQSYSSYRNECLYIETATGRRRMESRLTPGDGDRIITTIDYCDGTKSANDTRTDLIRTGKTIPLSRQVVLRRTFGLEESGLNQRPEPLRYFYVGMEPLAKAIDRAAPLGEGKVIWRGCEGFLFAKVKVWGDSIDFVYRLDRETSIPLRVDYFKNYEANSTIEPETFWRALKLESYGGVTLASKSEMISSIGSKPENRILQKYTITIDSVGFDASYPESLFWPEITQDVHVIDRITGKRSFPRVESTVKVAEGVQPIRAIERDGGPFTLGTTTLFVSLALLAAAAVIKLRSVVIRT